MKQHAADFPFSRPPHGPMPTPRRLLRLLIVTLCLSVAQPFAALAQTNTPAPLPPAAQEALNKGIIAAKVPDYPLAIRFFEEARKLAPQAPVVYLNMGLAESRLPSRELRAIAWFGAYLAGYPDAPNAAAVKEQIAVLDVKNQSNVSRLIKSVHAAYQTLDFNQQNLGSMVRLWAGSGDTTVALKTADDYFRRYSDNKPITLAYWRSWAQAIIAEAQAKTGDITGAQKTAALVTHRDFEVHAQNAIAEAQARSGISNAPTVFDWLKKLDDGPLNPEPFLDLPGYLKSLPASGDPQKIFDALRETAANIVTAQNIITGMLKQQAKK